MSYIPQTFLSFFPFPFPWPAWGSSHSTSWSTIVVFSPLQGNIFNWAALDQNLVDIVFMVAKLENICLGRKICVREAKMFWLDAVWRRKLFSKRNTNQVLRVFIVFSGGSRLWAKGAGMGGSRFWFTCPAGFSPFCHFLFLPKIRGAPPPPGLFPRSTTVVQVVTLTSTLLAERFLIGKSFGMYPSRSRLVFRVVGLFSSPSKSKRDYYVKYKTRERLRTCQKNCQKDWNLC